LRTQHGGGRFLVETHIETIYQYQRKLDHTISTRWLNFLFRLYLWLEEVGRFVQYLTDISRRKKIALFPPCPLYHDMDLSQPRHEQTQTAGEPENFAHLLY